jgi:DNA-binding CsgD family transcriptional regulator/PAS domain-containing protein
MARSRISEDQVVTAIYDTVLQPDSWQQCFQQMRDLVGADSMLATLQDPAAGEAQLLASNLDPRFLQHYASEWWTRDTWAMAGMAGPRGKAFLISDLVSDKEWLRSDIYNELVKPLADCRFCIGTILDVGEHRAVMGLHRTSTSPNFVRRELEILQRLSGHIGQSLRMAQQVGTRDDARALLEAAIDSLSFGLIVVDPDCRPLAMNRVAESCLGPGRGLLGGRAGEALRAENPRYTQLLHKLVREASNLSSAGAFRIERAQLPASRAPLIVQVAPLAGRRADTLGIRDRASLILLHVPTGAPLHAAVLQSLFGFTGAEARLAQAMAGGESLQEVAASTGLSINTVRTQLRSLLFKTDTDRQASLVRLLTQLSVRIDDIDG